MHRDQSARNAADGDDEALRVVPFWILGDEVPAIGAAVFAIRPIELNEAAHLGQQSLELLASGLLVDEVTTPSSTAPLSLLHATNCGSMHPETSPTTSSTAHRDNTSQ